MHVLDALIRQAEESSDSHVVVFITEQGIHWRPKTESACALMAEILSEYGAKSMPREEFICGLKKVVEEEGGSDAKN